MFEYSQKWNRVQAHIKIKWYTIYTDSHRDMHTHRKFRTDIFVGNRHKYTYTRHTYKYMQKWALVHMPCVEFMADIHISQHNKETGTQTHPSYTFIYHDTYTQTPTIQPTARRKWWWNYQNEHAIKRELFFLDRWILFDRWKYFYPMKKRFDFTEQKRMFAPITETLCSFTLLYKNKGQCCGLSGVSVFSKITAEAV